MEQYKDKRTEQMDRAIQTVQRSGETAGTPELRAMYERKLKKLQTIKARYIEAQNARRKAIRYE